MAFLFTNSISISCSTLVRVLQSTEKVIVFNDLFQISSLLRALNRVLLSKISNDEIDRSTDKR
jgi:hypothetical protein